MTCKQCAECKCNKKLEIDKEAMARNYSQAWVSEEDTTYLLKTLEIAINNL